MNEGSMTELEDYWQRILLEKERHGGGRDIALMEKGTLGVKCVYVCRTC